jgi:hypothetical protein
MQRQRNPRARARCATYKTHESLLEKARIAATNLSKSFSFLPQTPVNSSISCCKAARQGAQYRSSRTQAKPRPAMYLSHALCTCFALKHGQTCHWSLLTFGFFPMRKSSFVHETFRAVHIVRAPLRLFAHVVRSPYVRKVTSGQFLSFFWIRNSPDGASAARFVHTP